MEIASWWNKFLSEFCKVECLCWNGDPNWLGWGVIGFGVFMAVMIILGIFAIFSGEV